MFGGTNVVGKTLQSFMCLLLGFVHCVLRLVYSQPAVLIWSCIRSSHCRVMNIT
jgi:hypothetical protein